MYTSLFAVLFFSFCLYYSILEDFLQHGRLNGRSGKYGEREETLRKYRAKNWLSMFVNDGGCDAPDEQRSYLPSCWTVHDIYLTYKAELLSNGIEEDGLITQASFYRMWHDQFPDVYIRKVSKISFLQIRQT